jgi:hypothetical protein
MILKRYGRKWSLSNYSIIAEPSWSDWRTSHTTSITIIRYPDRHSNPVHPKSKSGCRVTWSYLLGWNLRVGVQHNATLHRLLGYICWELYHQLHCAWYILKGTQTFVFISVQVCIIDGGSCFANVPPISLASLVSVSSGDTALKRPIKIPWILHRHERG